MATRPSTPISSRLIRFFIIMFTVHLTNSLSIVRHVWRKIEIDFLSIHLIFFHPILIDHQVHTKARQSSNDALSRVANHQLNKNMNMTVSWIQVRSGKRRQLLITRRFLFLIAQCLCRPSDAHHWIFKTETSPSSEDYHSRYSTVIFFINNSLSLNLSKHWQWLWTIQYDPELFICTYNTDKIQIQMASFTHSRHSVFMYIEQPFSLADVSDNRSKRSHIVLSIH